MASFFIGTNEEDPAGEAIRPVVDYKQFQRPRRHTVYEDKLRFRRLADKVNVKPVISEKKDMSESDMNNDGEGEGEGGLTMKTEKASPPEKAAKSTVSNIEESNAERLLELLFMEKHGEAHSLFCELEELIDGIWCESARWVRFEEDVEVGGGRWSKPFVAALSLHSLFELRHYISTGTVMLDVDVNSFDQLTQLVTDYWVENNFLEESLRNTVIETLCLRHVHQFEHSTGIKRGITEIGKKLSAWRLAEENSPIAIKKPISIPENMSSRGTDSKDLSRKQNENFAKKLSPDCEASTSMVGGVDYLKSTVSAFIRLSSEVKLHECSEVSLPVRFVFILLGPSSRAKDLREIGRSMETLMSDDIFRNVAYQSLSRRDLLTGIDEFLDEGTALPPSEWDPTIRIEPPKSVPSSEFRKLHMLNHMSDKSMSAADLPAKVAVISRAFSEASFRRHIGLCPDGSNSESNLNIEPSIQANQVSASLSAIMDELTKCQTENDSNGKKPTETHSTDPSLQRTGRLFGGLVNDFKRKWPCYRSDFTDGFNMQCLASIFYLFFACLSPIVTFGGLLGNATDQHMAAFESILTAAVCGTTFHLFSGQPVTILGSTGPVLIFEKILFAFSKEYDMNYLTLRFWVGIWASSFLMLIVAFDLSALVQLITRFTEECFATLISVIFIFESFVALYGVYKTKGISTKANLAQNFTCSCDWVASNFSYVYSMPSQLDEPLDCRTADIATCGRYSPPCRRVGPGCDLVKPVPDVFFFSCLLFFGTCTLSFGMKNFRNSSFFPAKVRSFIGDFAVSISILLMVFVDYFTGLPTPKLSVPEDFAPTRGDRSWVVRPFDNPLWTIPLAGFPAILLSVLLFMDQQITAVIVNRKEHKLVKGKGYHLDLFILCLHVVFCASFGLPYFVAATVLAITHVNSLRKQSETSAPGEQPKFLGLIEQRVTGLIVFILIGCAIPLRAVLKYIPMPVLYGVFLYMGLAALQTSQFYSRVLLFFMPVKYQPDAPYLRHMKTWRVHLFTAIQLTAFGFLWVVKQVKTISLLFILMLVIMVILRKLLDHVFTQDELRWLDEILPENPLAVQKTAEDVEKVKKGTTNDDDEKPSETRELKNNRSINCPWRRTKRSQRGDQQAGNEEKLDMLAPPSIVVVSPSRDNSKCDIHR